MTKATGIETVFESSEAAKTRVPFSFLARVSIADTIA